MTDREFMFAMNQQGQYDLIATTPFKFKMVGIAGMSIAEIIDLRAAIDAVLNPAADEEYNAKYR